MASSNATPGEGTLSIAGLSLFGSHVTPNAEFAKDAISEPVAWITDAPIANVGEVWLHLARVSRDTGLIPVIAKEPAGLEGRPWTSGELHPEGDAQIAEDVLSQLTDGWSNSVSDGESYDEVVKPFGREFPGLASAVGGVRLDDAHGTVTAALQPARLLLVPANRPADVPAILGWMGATNIDLLGSQIATVLQSWEKRFGAVLLSMDFSTIQLLVTQPPATFRHALQVGAEHFAFCPDNVDQGSGTIREYVSQNVFSEGGKPSDIWTFWWD